MIQYAGLSEINGPLVCLEGAKGVSYDEIAEIKLEYAQMVLRGEMGHYLSLGCDHGRLED